MKDWRFEMSKKVKHALWLLAALAALAAPAIALAQSTSTVLE